MACGDCNGGCGGGITTNKLLDKAGLQHIVDVLSGKLFTVWGSLRVSGTAPLHLTKTVGDSGETIVEGSIDEATAASAGVMSAADKAKLDGLEAYGEATAASAGLMSSLQYQRLQELWDAYQSGAFTCPCAVEYSLAIDVEYNDGAPAAATAAAEGYLPTTTVELITRMNGVEGRTVVAADVMYVSEQTVDWATVDNEATGHVVLADNSGSTARNVVIMCTARYTAPDGTLLEAVENYLFYQAGVDITYSLSAELHYNNDAVLPAKPDSAGYAPSLSCTLLRTYPGGMSSRTSVEPSLVAWSSYYSDVSSPSAWASLDASGVLTVAENLSSSVRSVEVIADVYYDAPDGSVLHVRVTSSVEQAAAAVTSGPDIGGGTQPDDGGGDNDPDPDAVVQAVEEALTLTVDAGYRQLATGASIYEPATNTSSPVMSAAATLPAGCQLVIKTNQSTFGLRCQEGSDSQFAEPLAASSASVAVGVFIDGADKPTYSFGGGSITGTGVAGEDSYNTCNLSNTVTIAASDVAREIQLGIAVTSMSLRYMCNIYLTSAINVSAEATVTG